MKIKNVLLLMTLAVVLTFGLSLSVQSLIAAWEEPTIAAPGNNVAAPINVSADSQCKVGVLTTAGGFVLETRVNNPATPVDGRMWLITGTDSVCP
jgi:hypothetical protein